jgi:hypothetical protein
MGDHVHLVITDVRGEHPRFMHLLDLRVAKAMNAGQGRWEGFWATGQPDVVVLGTPEAVLEALAYVAVNPVKAGLVESPGEWPGVNLVGPQRRIAKRPARYFNPRGKLPAEVQISVEAPPAALQVPGWARRLRDEIARRVGEARREMKALGRRFVGRAGVLATSIEERAKSREVKWAIVPRVAAVIVEARVEMLRVVREFQAAYAGALEAWKAGDRDVVFPAGTWWMGVHHGARVAAPT